MNLMTFSNDSTVRCFISKFIANENVQSEQTISQLDTNQLFTLQFYHCLVKDTMHALGIYVDLLMVRLLARVGHQNRIRNSNRNFIFQALNRLQLEPRSNDVWQIKIIQTVLRHKHNETLLSIEHLNSLLRLTECHMENALEQRKPQLREFMFASNIGFLKHLQSQRGALGQIASVVVFYNIPWNLFGVANDASQANYLRMLVALKAAKISTSTIRTISRLLETGNDYY